MGREWSWTKSFKRGNKHRNPSAGCIGSVLQLFHLHQILFFSGSRSRDPTTGGDDPLFPNPGLEAPRNSLEMEAPSSLPPLLCPREELDIPLGIRSIPRRRMGAMEEEDEEVVRNSGGSHSARSRNLVARLMGLDHLPDRATFSPTTGAYHFNRDERRGDLISTSPRPCACSKSISGVASGSPRTPQPHPALQPRSGNILTEARHGTRSLPETPRASVTRRSWDSDPRLSVRLSVDKKSLGSGDNKENLTPSAIMELQAICVDHSTLLSPHSAKRKGKEYAREIVRQVKDSIGNTGGGSRGATLAKDHSAVRSVRRVRSSSCEKPQPDPILSLLHDPPQQQQAALPRPTSSAPAQSFFRSKQTVPPKSEPPGDVDNGLLSSEKRRLDRFNERIKRPPPAAAPHRKNALFSPSSALPIRVKTAASSSLAVPLPGFRLPKNGCYLREEEIRQPSRSPPPPGHIGEAEENRYVKNVLYKAGLHGRVLCPSAVRWFSPLHPLDPIIFHELELRSSTSQFRGHLRRRCNRRLLFDLVDELLAEALCVFLTSSGRRQGIRTPCDGDDLLRRLIVQIGAYPSADCQVMEDIDALVELDLPEGNVRQLLRHPAVAEEADAAAWEVERTLLDNLLEDCVLQLLRPRQHR